MLYHYTDFHHTNAHMLCRHTYLFRLTKHFQIVLSFQILFLYRQYRHTNLLFSTACLIFLLIGYLYYICTSRSFLFNVIPPETNYRPTFGFKFRRYLSIAPHITFNFRYPKFLMGLKVSLSFFPIVSMPKFTVTENSYLFSDEHNIWLSEYAVHVLPVTKTARP